MIWAEDIFDIYLNPDEDKLKNLFIQAHLQCMNYFYKLSLAEETEFPGNIFDDGVFEGRYEKSLHK